MANLSHYPTSMAPTPNHLLKMGFDIYYFIHMYYFWWLYRNMAFLLTLSMNRIVYLWFPIIKWYILFSWIPFSAFHQCFALFYIHRKKSSFLYFIFIYFLRFSLIKMYSFLMTLNSIITGKCCIIRGSWVSRISM